MISSDEEPTSDKEPTCHNFTSTRMVHGVTDIVASCLNRGKVPGQCYIGLLSFGLECTGDVGHNNFICKHAITVNEKWG